MTLDEAFETAKLVFLEAESNLQKILSEEDAKIQIVNRILIEVLGWSHADIQAEAKVETGFSDYVLNDSSHPAFVLEAKKIGRLSIKTQATTRQDYKISGPALAGAIAGIQQAATYCAPIGAQLAVVSDGLAWIVFLPFIPGASYKSKQAITFPGFEAILNDFSTFFELLSKQECRKNTYKLIFDKIHENRLVQTQVLSAPFGPSDIRIEQKSALAFDLEKVFSRFFANLSGHDDPNLLIDCFVESRESRIADFSLEKITKNVLGNLVSADDSVDKGLSTLIEDALHANEGETVFVVGPSGAGKSTFLDRFFRRTLSSEVRSQCLVLTVNFIDSTGDKAPALSWITNQLIEKIERQLFKDSTPSWNDLLALYYGEYLKRSNGVDAVLYNRSKEEFKEKFATFIDSKVETDREGYLERLLKDAVSNRKKLPVFVVDNTDEFEPTFKEIVFQYFQALRRATGQCLVIFAATDRSAWAFSKTEIFNIYSSKSFFLPTPSPREVLRKRIDYLREKLIDKTDSYDRGEYVLGKGIKITIKDLSAFAALTEGIFVNQDYASKRVGELSNYNMRKTLSLFERVITSSVLAIDDVVKSFLAGEIAIPSVDVFMRALLLGDFNVFKEDDKHFVLSMYQADTKIRQSPLINLRVLLLLQQAHINSSDDQGRYLSVSSIYNFFDLMGHSEAAIEQSLIVLLEAGLIEPYDLSKKDYSQDQMLAIRFSGIAHIDLATSNQTYFEQLALTTRITSRDCALQIRNAWDSAAIVREKQESVRKLFYDYLAIEDCKFSLFPSDDSYDEQRHLLENIKANMLSKPKPKYGSVVLTGVVAEVEAYYGKKGFGFAKLAEFNESAFFHITGLEAAGFGPVEEGDELLCDVKTSEKGYTISQIHDVNRAPPVGNGVLAVKVHQLVVSRAFAEREYGFAHVEELGVDAFFHFSKFPVNVQESLEDGFSFDAEIASHPDGKWQVRRVVSPIV